MTQQELGKALGISTSTVGMYEQGRRSPDHATLLKICQLFEVSSDSLLLDSPVPSEQQAALQSNIDLNDVIEDFRAHLLSQQGLMFNGMPLSESDIAQVVDAIEVGTMVAVEKLRRRTNNGGEA
ncbi:MAG: helix-turn-helix transcriptional regulator [Anaerotruncus sp.]|nr:helix-turn-helix transcriptional regulator [Anaerotruncus sp.]